MSLSLYKQKRNFSDTPEPAGKEKSSAKGLKFVVQKHDASHLHYDFRLELNGVLLSWAVPKGPSLDPSDKRLAMHVEDHPYDYRTFEGVIPEGNYGAGTVIVWDEGIYEPEEPVGKDVKSHEKELKKQYYAGNMKFVLHGKKLRGSFALVRLQRDEKSWLLIKHRDEYAQEADITKESRSVKTGRTIAEVAEDNGTVPKHPEAEPAPAKGVKRKPASAPKEVWVSNRNSAGEKKTVPAKNTSSKKAAPATKAVAKPAAKKTAPSKKAAPSKKKVKAASELSIEEILGDALSGVKKRSFPSGIEPMKATLVDEPFSDADWLYEIKWDGFRAVAECSQSGVELVSRNAKPFTGRFPAVVDALKELPFEVIFDGEVVAVDAKGMANFQALQNEMNAPAEIRYYIFDVLWVSGYDVTGLPLTKRKELVRALLPAEHPVLYYSDHVVENGELFFKAALKQGLEGIMAKKKDSVYEPGSRSNAWLKVKVNQRQEVVIGGFTQPRNSRKYFGALLLGAYVDGKLTYVGHTGSGFNTKSLEMIHGQLLPLATDVCPFEDRPKGNMPVTWVKPKLVCEIKFTEWTKDWIARHPIFMGMRTDKKPKDVIIEKSKKSIAMVRSATKKSGAKKAAPKKAAAPKKGTTKAAAPKAAAKAAAPKKGSSKSSGKEGRSSGAANNGITLENGKDQSLVLGKQSVALTNLDKIYWPKEGTRKLDVINYYSAIAPYILPYLKDRPESLHRHPNGINGQHFFQKNMGGKMPGWIPTHTDFSESTGKDVHYLVCNDEATLIYMANMGCIELHPWHSRTGSWQYPDWCLIDLDPEGTMTFNDVILCAQVVKKVLDTLGIEGYPKTSGSSGIHIYIPLGAQIDYPGSKTLAEIIVTLVNRELPAITSLERSPAKRKNKIYLDYLQNRETQTAAAPYSLRPKPGVPVSTPLDWSEVKKGLTPTTYNMHNIFDRLKTEGDLYKPVLGKGVNIEKVLQKGQALL